MYISRIRLNQGHDVFDFLKQHRKDLYSDHQLIWSLFPDRPDEKRDFLFRKEIRYDRPVFYLLSEKKPESAHSFLSVDTKKFDPVIRENDAFYFSLRANPVVAKKVEGQEKSKRYDVWMNARHEGKAQGLTGTKLLNYSEDRVKEWFISRASDFGFSLEEEALVVDNYQQNSFYKKKDKGGNITIGSVDFNGVLRVTDREKFRQTLVKGIGKSKSFGCGLLLIRR